MRLDRLRRWTCIAVAGWWLAGVPSPGYSQPEPAGQLLISGATLIDGTGGPPLVDAALLVNDGRIEKVGPSGSITAPRARTVDAAGRFIVPGLIDAHVHYRDWLGEMLLAHGVTSAFDLGDPSDWIFAVREALARGLIRGPRLYVSGNLIDGDAEGPRARMGGGSGSGRDRANRTLVTSVEEARAATRALVARGADLIKVYQDLTDEQLAAVADEAHAAGLSVFGHTYHVERAAAAGLDVITHLWGVASSCMSPEELDLYQRGEIPSPYPALAHARAGEIARSLAASGTHVNPLLINEHAGVNRHSPLFRDEVKRLLDRPELGYVPADQRLGLILMFDKVRNYASRFGLFPPIERLPPDALQQFRDGYPAAGGFVRDFVAAGGRIVAGTDTAGASMTPGLSLHHELRLLVDSGLTPMQAISAATRIPGELVKNRDAVGTLQPGMRADFLILEADPLADIGNLRRIVAVYKDGRAVDTSYHADYRSAIPYPIEEFSSSYIPTPVLRGIEPMSAPAGSGAVELTVRGIRFSMTSTVTAGGRLLPTRFVDSSRLEAALPAELVAQIGTVPIAVQSPRPGGGTSNAYGFVVSPAPSGPGPRAAKEEGMR